jgi:hypothetical protein
VLCYHLNRLVLGVSVVILPVPALTFAAEQTSSPGEQATPADIIPFKVLRIVNRPVDVLFKGFVENPFKALYEPKFNWGRNNETDFVILGESFHSYKVYPLEKKIVEVEQPGSPPRKEERYFITLKKPGEDPVVIEKARTVRINERVAALEAKEGKWLVQHRDDRLSAGEKTFEVFDGCVIREMGGEARSFTIASVTDNAVRLVSRREIVIPDDAAPVRVQGILRGFGGARLEVIAGQWRAQHEDPSLCRIAGETFDVSKEDVITEDRTGRRLTVTRISEETVTLEESYETILHVLRSQDDQTLQP